MSILRGNFNILIYYYYCIVYIVGYRRGNYNTSSNWDLMWAHDYPFKKIKEKMLAMKKGQRINKFPGSGFITNKVGGSAPSPPNSRNKLCNLLTFLSLQLSF